MSSKNILSFYVPIFTLTLFISAALLFSVQPLFSKMILPLMGGAPQVWTTAMLFFQAALLLGYGYAHASAKFLRPKLQAIIHIVLLLTFSIFLPLAIPENWQWSENQSPVFWQLAMMTIAIGGPFFILAASAPLFQHWFSKTDHKHSSNPYFLYAASNFGSMGSLLVYPFIIEPFLSVQEQSIGWSIGYGALILCTLACALLLNRSKTAFADTSKDTAGETEEISWKRRGYWMVTAFIPSSLMLGVTHHVTTDIAAVPLLWIIPLALYVGTFILVFARKQILSINVIMILQALIVAFISVQLFSHSHLPALVLVTVHFTAFFFSAWSMHHLLAASKPGPSRLTEFYMFMSLGGVLGGLFNAIIAVEFFVVPFEYVLVLAASCFFRKPIAKGENASKNIWTSENLFFVFIPIATIAAFFLNDRAYTLVAAYISLLGLLFILDTRWRFFISITVLLALSQAKHAYEHNVNQSYIHFDRNYFGVVSIVDAETENGKGLRRLKHGTTIHGMQSLEEDSELELLSYYGKGSPVTDAFGYMDQKPYEQNIGIFGLGVGSVACYSNPNREFTFYEIDPDIAELAENKELFTYLSDCGSPYDIVIGDARLTVQDQPNHVHDFILLDAFTSDNIPVHLLTTDAVSSFLKKVKKDNSFLIFNISNRFLDVEILLSAVADNLGLETLAKISLGPDADDKENAGRVFASHFMILHNPGQDMSYFTDRGWKTGYKKEGLKPWSDNYSNIISIMDNKSYRNHAHKILRARKEAEEKKKEKEKN